MDLLQKAGLKARPSGEEEEESRAKKKVMVMDVDQAKLQEKMVTAMEALIKISLSQEQKLRSLVSIAMQ
eukprot:371831-Karenia_brevis.AAC.1